MQVETLPGHIILLTDLMELNLDPITVVLRDIAPGVGEITVSCWGAAWTARFGAMPTEKDGRFMTVRSFCLVVSTAYLANRMINQLHRRTVQNERYLLRIVAAVQEGLRVMPL